MLIGLSGRKFSGKDTVAMYLGLKYERRKFAEKLKKMISVLLDCSVQALEDHEFKEAPILGTLNPRTLMQTLGTEWGRALDENIWVNAATWDLQPEHNVVFTDVRFPNEAEAIKKLGGVLIKVMRPHLHSTDTHPSETSLDDYDDWDYVIDNSSTLDDLRKEILKAVTKLGL
jgi:hypothetical protein